MRTRWTAIVLGIFLLAACTPAPVTSTSTSVVTPKQTPVTSTSTSVVTPKQTPLPEVEGFTVTRASDSGPGSLRQAIEDAQPHDTITFDPDVFPPDAPAIIQISSELPHIRVANLTVDASNAGVILDGSQVPGDWTAGLQIVSAEAVTIMGLQISNFPGPGIAISGDSQHNVIGGDRSIGAGPFGQGNQISNNKVGIDLASANTTLNTVIGNLIGTDLDGSDWLGNKRDGVAIWEGAHDNTIGPNNIIANNGRMGVNIGESESSQNTVSQNNIYDNGIGKGVPLSPVIIDFNLAAGTASGITCALCTVEIYSTNAYEGEILEDQVIADENGTFTFDKGALFTGPALTARTTSANGIQSKFSWPPTLGTEGKLFLQKGNDSPSFLLFPKLSQSLPNNHIGAWFEDHGRYNDTGFVCTRKKRRI